MSGIKGRSGRPAIGPRVGTTLPPETDERLRDWAERHGMTRAEAIRTAIEGLLAEDVGQQILWDSSSTTRHAIMRSGDPSLWWRRLSQGREIATSSGAGWSVRLVSYLAEGGRYPGEKRTRWAVDMDQGARRTVYDYPQVEDAQRLFNEWQTMCADRESREHDDGGAVPLKQEGRNDAGA